MIQCDILKERSYISCLRDSFELICSNFAHIMRRTWIPAVAFAVLMAVSVVAMDDVILIVSTIASIVAASYLCACCLSEVVEGGRRRIFLRTLKAWAFIVIVAMLFVAAAMMLMMITSKFAPTEKQPTAPPNLLPYVLATCAVYIVMFIVLVPTFYSSMKYIIDGTTKLRTIYGGSYKTGWRNWGRLFTTTLLIGLISIVIVGIVSLPIIVITLAERANAQGVALGDATALPGGFTAMRFAVIAIASFINAYVSVWALYAQYLVFGHIEAKAMKKTNTPQE